MTGGGSAFAQLQAPLAPTAPMVTLSAEDKSDMEYVKKLPRHGSSVEMDLSDPIQYRHFIRQWEIGGVTRATSPRLYRAFDELRESHVARRRTANADQPMNLTKDITPQSTATDPIVPLNFVSSFGRFGGANYNVSAITSVPGTLQVDGTVTATTIGLYDANNNQLGPASTQQQFGNGALMVNGNQAPPPGSGDVQAAGTYYYKYVDANNLTVTAGGHLFARQTQTTTGSYTMQNLAPVDVNNNGTIKVCIVRSDSDCDYHYAAQGGQFIVEFPINDNFTVPDTLLPLAQQQSSGAWVNVYVAQIVAGQGGGCTLPSNFNFWNALTINGTVASWNLNPGPFSNPDGQSSPCFPTNSNVLYDLQLNLIGTPSGGGTSYWFGEVKTTSNPPPPPGPGVANLLPMVVAYGCVAEGTPVTLADGSRTPIEQIALGERVRNADGAVLTVTKRTEGVERKPMIRVVAENGYAALLTDTHPVMTDAGARMAGQLASGMIVMTADGPARIARVARETFAGKVWNLDLGSDADAVALSDTNTTMIAGGLVIGDGKMQQRLEQDERAAAARRNIAVIPEEWRVDAANFAARQQQQETMRHP